MYMAQKINTPRFPIHAGLFFLLILIPLSLPAQEKKDSIRILRDSISIRPESMPFHSSVPGISSFRKTDIAPLYPSGQLHLPLNFLRKGEIRLPYQTNPSPRFKGDYSTGGILKQFSHGALFGSGQQTSVPGIGRFNNASLGYRHIFNDKFELQLQAYAMKINMTHSTGQAFSTSGALLYHASDRVAFKAFGSYGIGNSYGMNTHNYGATISVDMSDRFNMEMGVQRYYDAMRGRWETVPVVIPSYRFNKFTLGLDVGGILYEILRNAVFDKRDSGGSGPTIAPPRFSIPIRPR
ncbi:hypothetical protein [uncultured Bacteroides sp.]|uniref:hypothetical protein n=1 Tax=uncultured Bacteroides sp. TaxID=162156 RepID=UPI0026764E4E|nr:hypothetical protein [uncultured Bacteroides sp.]